MAWNTVGSIRGPQGEPGVKGDPGDTGAAGVGIEIDGSVATYAELPTGLGAGDAGSAYEVLADGKLYVWSGTQFPADGSGSEFRGPQGNPGPANSLSIGTVSNGGSPGASITGTAPNQTLNLTLQKGDTGETGPANSLSIGTVESGSSPEATITGTAPDQTLNLTLQKGDTGDVGETGETGPPNSLTIGSVSSGGAPGASITGNAPNQTLNLVLVPGDTGATGDPGETGDTGATGQRGSLWFTGSGAPGTIGGSLAGDLYLDTVTGEVYKLS